MLAELEPVWGQLVETLQSLLAALDEIPEEDLCRSPAPWLNSAGTIVQHIARANIDYANMILPGAAGEKPDYVTHLSRESLYALLEDSLKRVGDVFGKIPQEHLHTIRAEDWEPLGYMVNGPLDGLWFAMQTVRHTAYHMGQVVIVGMALEAEKSVA